MKTLFSVPVLVLGLCSLALPQDPPTSPPTKPPVKPPAQQQPTGPVVQSPAPRRTPAVPIPSIEDFRQGAMVEVVRGADALDLDLGGVDLDADTLLSFDGKPIVQEDLRRHLCIMAGGNEIDQYVTFVIGNQVKKQLADAGHDVSSLGVSEEELEKDIETQMQMAPRIAGVSGEEWKKQITEQLGWEKFLEMRRTSLSFGKLFLPDPPPGFLEKQKAKFDEMQKAEQDKTGEQDPEQPQTPQALPVPEADLSFLPKKTFELLPEGVGQEVKNQYARGQPIHPLMKMGFTEAIKRNLMADVSIEFYPEGSPPEVLCTVEGEKVLTNDIYAQVQHRLKPEIRRTALREIVTGMAVDAALARLDACMSPKEASEAFQAKEKEYNNTIFPLRNVVQLLGFQNVYHYRSYFNRKVAFVKYIKAKATDEELARHFEKSGRLFFEDGSYDGTVLFFKGDEETSLHSMNDALSRIADGQKSFAQIARLEGEFSKKNRDVRDGAVPPLVRNRMRMIFGESEWSTFVTGYSMADEVFYRGIEGQTFGPVFRDFLPDLTGALAFEVGRYYTGNNQRSLEQYGKERAFEDYADVRFGRFINDAMLNCNIELPN